MMNPSQRKAFSEACAILNAAQLPDVNALLVALHAYYELHGNCGSPAQQATADVVTHLLDGFVTYPDVRLSSGSVVRHLPAANGSTDAVLRAGRSMSPAEWNEYAAIRRASASPEKTS